MSFVERSEIATGQTRTRSRHPVAFLPKTSNACAHLCVNLTIYSIPVYMTYVYCMCVSLVTISGMCMWLAIIHVMCTWMVTMARIHVMCIWMVTISGMWMWLVTIWDNVHVTGYRKWNDYVVGNHERYTCIIGYHEWCVCDREVLFVTFHQCKLNLYKSTISIFISIPSAKKYIIIIIILLVGLPHSYTVNWNKNNFLRFCYWVLARKLRF